MLEAHGASDPGCVRRNNEDRYLVDQQLGLYVVADGMGGAQAGEQASRIAVEAIASHIARSPRDCVEDLTNAFEEANRRVLETAAADPELEGMGTTLVALLECSGRLAVASVGDSRAYRFHDGRLEPLTEDQNWASEVGRRLGLADEVLRTHPLRHVLTMAIGVARSLRVFTGYADCPPGSLFLLCSDGLHGVVPAAVIAGTLRANGSLEEKNRRLIDAARQAGGPDNITTVLVRAGDEVGGQLRPK
jgi:serine/threonine protein phosphatase PrpC